MDGKLSIAADDRDIGKFAAVKETLMTVRFQIESNDRRQCLLAEAICKCSNSRCCHRDAVLLI